MAVVMKLPTILAGLADGPTVALPGSTVGEAVAELSRRYPLLGRRLGDAAGAPMPFVTFFVNGTDIRSAGGFAAPVADGDEITVVVPVAGG
jgi:molybdopterin converting factor small subunit